MYFLESSRRQQQALAIGVTWEIIDKRPHIAKIKKLFNFSNDLQSGDNSCKNGMKTAQHNFWVVVSKVVCHNLLLPIYRTFQNRTWNDLLIICITNVF